MEIMDLAWKWNRPVYGIYVLLVLEQLVQIINQFSHHNGIDSVS